MELLVQIASIVVAIVSLGIGIFQILLFLGFPLAEYSWGGKYEGVLPKNLRIMSFPSAFILFFFGFIFLVHTNVLPLTMNLPTTIFVWINTVFLGLNTLGNLASKSKKERMVMTPIAGVAFVSCLLVAIFS